MIKKAMIEAAASLLVLSSLAMSAVVFPKPILASPAQLFGRDSKPEDKTRLLTGKVLDGGDSPLPDAVVYLTNTHTRAVKTYIVGADGTYRFPALQPSIDYEVYAQFNNHKSHTKTVSQFDDRQQVYIDLKINTKGEGK
ncbi:MAG TPA: carboxypeptidase-like regulatory domain-containing protein [Terriglobales bacterium]|nr:carboxypeptidase-like regulatory domain-containing protein [Terriglobales bacterium]